MLDTKLLPSSRSVNGAAKPAVDSVKRSWLANLFVLLASGGLLWIGWQLFQQRMTNVMSRDAVISGDFVDMMAPIEGTVQEFSARPGQQFMANQPLLLLQNERAGELGVQQLQSRINDLQLQKQRLEGQIDRNQALILAVAQEGATEVELKLDRASETTEQMESERDAKATELEMAEINLGRMEKLQLAGAIPMARLDEAQLTVKRLSNDVKAHQAKVDRAELDRQTTQTGLNPDRERNNYDARIRQQELRSQIADQKAELALVQQQQKSAQAELTKIKSDQQKINLGQARTPIEGVLYDLKVRPGQFVQKGTYLGRMLNCRQRWVDVTVDESALKSIAPGKLAKISLHALPNKSLTGKVTLIRSGMGRLQAGQDITQPVAANLPRTSQVRVELDPETDQGLPENLCYVGYTGKVAFPTE